MSNKNEKKDKKNTGLAVIPKKKDPLKRMRVTTLIRHNYTPEEMALKGIELSKESIELQQIDRNKTQVMSEFKQKFATCNAKISLISTMLQNGYEMKNMKVDKVVDFDAGFKFFYDITSGHELQRDKLTQDDYELQFEEQENKR